MKPLGITADLRCVMPTKTEDLIWNAVESAIEANWTTERFKREAADAWSQSLRRAADEAMKGLTS